MKYVITMKDLNETGGYLVEIGCERFFFPDVHSALAAIKAYLLDPEIVEVRYQAWKLATGDIGIRSGSGRGPIVEEVFDDTRQDKS